jgi:hypothetical protein
MESNMDEEIPGMDAEDIMDVPTVTLTDEAGRTLTCYVEQSLNLEGQDYVLLLPVDAPVEIFSWHEDDEDEDAAIPVETEAEIDQVFPIAKAVLEEQNLVLKRTAVTLTVEGELPEFEDDEELIDEEGESEDLQLLASFYHEEQEYAIYSPLDPFLVLARLDAQGQPHLLSAEEMQQLEPLLPMLEDQLFSELE